MRITRETAMLSRISKLFLREQKESPHWGTAIVVLLVFSFTCGLCFDSRIMMDMVGYGLTAAVFALYLIRVLEFLLFENITSTFLSLGSWEKIKVIAGLGWATAFGGSVVWLISLHPLFALEFGIVSIGIMIFVISFISLCRFVEHCIVRAQ